MKKDAAMPPDPIQIALGADVDPGLGGREKHGNDNHLDVCQFQNSFWHIS